jgi:hypothetical protein
MILAFFLGILVGILIMVGILRMSMREDPTGCLVIFGLVFFLLLMAAVLSPMIWAR